jgi:hypothetical protein
MVLQSLFDVARGGAKGLPVENDVELCAVDDGTSTVHAFTFQNIVRGRVVRRFHDECVIEPGGKAVRVDGPVIADSPSGSECGSDGVFRLERVRVLKVWRSMAIQLAGAFTT